MRLATKNRDAVTDMVRSQHVSQRLSNSGPQRERLREKGQFWTPDWIAEAMIVYVTSGGSDHIFDPAVGTGAFFLAAKKLAEQSQRAFRLLGTEVDPETLGQARSAGLEDTDLAQVEISDFVLQPPAGPFQAIVANPPYIRHHRLSPEVKTKLKALCMSVMGKTIDGRAGLHIYFLLRALQLLGLQGRLAFIMPADTCEGVFASLLWKWLTSRYRLEAVITFAPTASPFQGVDTNPLVFLIRHDVPTDRLWWVRCEEPHADELKTWVLNGLGCMQSSRTLAIRERRLGEALETGLSRAPIRASLNGPRLSDFAMVRRGIATGANEFFLLTSQQVDSLGVPYEFFVSAIGRSRDVSGVELTEAAMEDLNDRGRATWLLSVDDLPQRCLPTALYEYLKWGEHHGIHQRALISTKAPWYKMERRPIPPILFAYLGRRHCRFIRNRAGVVPLTGFLCVYPNRSDEEFADRLLKALNHPETLANLPLVAKSYGGGALKVEPRALERLPLSTSALRDVGLSSVGKEHQLEFS